MLHLTNFLVVCFTVTLITCSLPRCADTSTTLDSTSNGPSSKAHFTEEHEKLPSLITQPPRFASTPNTLIIQIAAGVVTFLVILLTILVIMMLFCPIVFRDRLFKKKRPVDVEAPVKVDSQAISIPEQQIPVSATVENETAQVPMEQAETEQTSSSDDQVVSK